MQVKGLDGKFYNWDLRGLVPETDTRPRSSLHLKAREILKELYPLDQILEEVPVPHLGGFFDFYLPLRRLTVEVQGEQHYTFNSFFHQNKFQFFNQQKRDLLKIEWCELNDIRLIQLKYNAIDQWKDTITGHSEAETRCDREEVKRV